ncbi:hypothetical protein BYT27DRAFT_7192905 [Phlegmacium glaucopus]|nr:hypothetical protein BYT27DRAFT_7192905 [Phlegmacium glaucopus]
MGRLFALPTSLRGRLAIVGSFAGLYALAYMFYIFGSPLFEGRQQQQPLIVGDTNLSSPSLPVTNGTDDSSNRPRILLVTAMFDLSNNSNSKPKEDAWIHHFLGEITSDIYVFTTPVLESYILQLRGSNTHIIVDTSFSTPFDIPPLKGKEDAYKQMRKKDRQKSRSHTPEFFALHNSKPFFLHTALQKTGVNASVPYDYAFWNDIANFHEEHQYREWPSPSRVRDVWEEGSVLTGISVDELMFMPMWGLPHSTFLFWNEGMGPIDNDFSQGSFFGGPPKAINWYTRAFYAYHDKYLSLDIFIGKDQATANALLVLFPDRFITVWYNDPIAPAHLQLNRTVQESFLGQCNSERVYYRFWLADEETQDKMRDMWLRKQDRWKWWGWWRPKDRMRCQSTRVLAMKEVLRRLFGTGWEPPHASIPVPATLNWDH